MVDASRQAQADEQDASMDTILASIRRIIMEDEASASPPERAAEHNAEHGSGHDAEDEVLVLQPSMIVDPEGLKGAPMAKAGLPRPGEQSAADLAAALFDDPAPLPTPVMAQHPLEPPAGPPAGPPAALPTKPPQAAPAPPTVAGMAPEPATPPADMVDEPLLDPAASQAAARSLASLHDAMRPPPSGAMHLLRSGGPTIEDLVRDELRMQLKDWLDANLPSLVERLVAQEIDRLVGRS